MIAFLIFKSSSQNIDLVSPDYYAQELKFQDKIDGQNNMNSLTEQIVCSVDDNNLMIQFPKALNNSETTGEVLIYRPSDASLDVKTAFKPDTSGLQKIETASFKRGSYKIQVSCAAAGKNYFFEQDIFIN